MREGKIKTCGLCHANSIIGQKINNWTILDKTEERRNTYVVFKCQCDCGNIAYKTISEIKSAEGKYCQKCHIKDISGQKFGKLTAIKHLGTDKNRHSEWLCECECGNTVVMTLSHLLYAKYPPSCGKCISSHGEQKIMEILDVLNIEYETQKTFENCRFTQTGALAKFDFYLPQLNLLIEYDGSQHFKEISHWESLEKVQARDAYKNQWCKENNIPLIRIPYTQYTKLTTKYLLNLIEEAQ